MKGAQASDQQTLPKASPGVLTALVSHWVASSWCIDQQHSPEQKLTQPHLVHYWLILGALYVRVMLSNSSSFRAPSSTLGQSLTDTENNRQPKPPGVSIPCVHEGPGLQRVKCQPKPTPRSPTAYIRTRRPTTRATTQPTNITQSNRNRVMACRHRGPASVRPYVPCPFQCACGSVAFFLVFLLFNPTHESASEHELKAQHKQVKPTKPSRGASNT